VEFHQPAQPAVQGEAASPLAPPPGCAFHPRCPFVIERCRRERPTLAACGDQFAACHRAAELDLG